MEGSIEVRQGGPAGRIPWTNRVRVGSTGCEVPLASQPAGELHLWPSPPRLVLVGGEDVVLLNGRAVEEAPLAEGDTIQWAGGVLVVHPAPVLEELPSEGATTSKPSGKRAGKSPLSGKSREAGASAVPVAPVALDLSRDRAAARLLAGVAAELGVGDREATKRWQAAVLRGEWDADAAAREVLAGVDPEAPALVERAGRVQRDLLMASLQRGIRGAARKARGAARGGSAFFVANLVAVSVYTLLVAGLAVIVRARYDWSLDGAIDGLLEAVGGLIP